MSGMNDTIRTAPEVDAFVTAVRACFSDLTPDEREDLLDGLEADTADLVAERGPEALGDPRAYAAELRSAAGLPPAAGALRKLAHGVPPLAPAAAIEEARRWFDAAVAERAWAGSAMEFLTAVRPAWWVLRAWLLVQAADVMLGPWEELTLVPSLMIPGAGLVLFVLALVASVQVGRGRWPTGRFAPSAHRRALVLAGNVAVLLIALPLTISQAGNHTWSDYGYAMASSPTGVTNDGRQVCNLQAYDVAGQPLAGVQLFDDRGRAFDVRCPDRYGKAAYPWYLGDVARWNVFPMAERRQRTDDRMVEGAYESPRPPAFPLTDRASVPAVTHPLVPAPSLNEVLNEEPTEEPTAGPTKDSAKDTTKDSAKGDGKRDGKDADDRPGGRARPPGGTEDDTKTGTRSEKGR